MNSVQCPKCAYVRTAADTAPIYECPKCGIVYEKYKPVTRTSNNSGLSAKAIPPVASAKTRNPMHESAKRFLYILASLFVLATASYLVDPWLPVVLVVAITVIWIVRKAIEGSKEQELKEAAEFQALPFQHCMTCGHDFKHKRSALRGSTTMEIALWILLLWPIALVYSIWRRLGAGKAKVACLVCASTQVVPANSPAAIAHKRSLGIQDA